MHLELIGTYCLAALPHNNGVRLAALDNGNEIACRKETIKNLLKFINGQDAQIFKGRLQFSKRNGTISIQVKGNAIGNITDEQLRQLLKAV